ncbi:MAG: hypothetical protein IPK74_18500 [Deltaproteobacteria bacterium]|nr:hypothetical protein [Deltaproteobacteria bacterium]
MVASSACGARWGGLWPGAVRAAASATTLALALAGPGHAQASPTSDEAEANAAATARPRDPNDAPMMAPRGGQPPTSDRRLGDDWSRGRSSRRRLALSVAPIFASYRLAFIGRPLQPARGGGLAVDLDVQLLAPLWLRVGASYSAHALFDQFERPEGEAPQQTARRGVLHTVDAGGALLLAMDLGRVRPMLEAGAGILLMRQPRDPVQDGQLGGACIDGGGCDVGLFCATAQNVCRQGVVPCLHAGAGIEVLVADRFSIGVMLRYFALLLAPTVFPVYLQTGVRATVRF